MAAVAFVLPYPIVALPTNVGAPGAKLYFYSPNTTTIVPVYSTSALTTQLSNPVIADGAGRVPNIWLNGANTYKLVIKSKSGATLYTQDPYTPGTLTGVVTAVGAGVATVTPQDYQVSAGLALPLGGGVQNDSAAFVAAIAYLKTLAKPDNQIYYEGSPRLFVPAGMYNMGTTTLDITHTLIIEGESGLNGLGSRLRWSGDATGIRIQAYNTTGASSTTAAGFNAGQYTIIRNLGLTGPYKDATDFTTFTEGEYHGIHARSNYIIEDCYIEGFAGDGLHVFTSVNAGGAEEGNSNSSFVNRLQVKCVRNGVFIDGSDANVGTFIGVVGTYCRQHTVWDSSSLGNIHIGHHSANAGLVAGVPSCLVSVAGNRYFVKQGQAVGASTNAPPKSTVTMTIASPGVITWTAHGLAAGTAIGLSTTGALPTGLVAGTTYYVVSPTTNAFSLAATVGGSAINTTGSQSGVHTASAGVDNTWWLWYGAGAVDTTINIPAWSNGVSVREGGSYCTDSVTAFNTWIGFYVEGGEAAPQFASPTVVIGGLVGGARDTVTTGNLYGGAKCELYSFKLVPRNDASPLSNGMMWAATAGDKIRAQLGGASVNVMTDGGGTLLTKTVVYTPSITPASVAAATVAEQTFTVTGLTTADKVTVNPPAIGNATGIAGVRVSAADTLAIRFTNPTAGALTPTSGTYTVLAFRS